MVLSVDEKPHIQVLERAQGYLRLPNGKTLSGFSHDYKRHGTTTLFAAFNVLTGQVPLVHHRQRRRRREFLDFMNEVIAAYGPDQVIHVILDNLSTHKPKHDTLAGASPQRAPSLYPDPRELAQPGRMLAQHFEPAGLRCELCHTRRKRPSDTTHLFSAR